jgi:hypothetical protein
LEAPVLDVAARIVAILEEVSNIAAKYVVKDEGLGSQAKGGEASKSVAQGVSTVLPIVGAHNSALMTALTQHRTTASTLQKRNSFQVRLMFGSKPWGQPDKATLEEKADELCYWNDRLESLLPKTLEATLKQQARPAQLIDENKDILDELIRAAEHQSEAVRVHARFWKERLNLPNLTSTEHMIVDKYRRISSSVTRRTGIPASGCDLHLATFQAEENGKG